MRDETTPRIAAVDPEAMTPAQHAAAAVVAAGPRGSVRGPFAVLLNSPGAFAAAQGLGAYLRFESPIPANLRELAILATARSATSPRSSVSILVSQSMAMSPVGVEEHEEERQLLLASSARY